MTKQLMWPEKADRNPRRSRFLPGRRDFLARLTALGAAGLLSPLLQAAETTAALERRAVATWDFSWLTRRLSPEAEFGDWDRALDGLAERGYNRLRIDAFPHLIAADPAGNCAERFTMLPHDPAFPWGNHSPVTIEPRKSLLEFLEKCRVRGLRLGLSSWFGDDHTHRRATIQTPGDFSVVWEETLDLIAQAGLLSVVEWVDLCSDFPLPPSAFHALQYLNEASRTPLVIGSYNTEQQKLLSWFMQEAIGPLHEKFSGLRFCFSLGNVTPRHLKHVNFRHFGLLDQHLWLSKNLEFAVGSGTWMTRALILDGVRYARIPSAVAYYSNRPAWLQWMKLQLKKWAEFGRAKNLPLWTAEGWGPILWYDLPHLEDAREWRWVKDVCERAVDLALEAGWEGLCSSNFCAPHFPGMWNDQEWHRKITGRIRGG